MKITIIGSGTWATALANVFAYSHHQVLIVARDSSSFDNNKHINIKYFPNKILNENITFTTSLKDSLSDCDAILLCVPSKIFRAKLTEINHHLNHKVIFLNATKGLDENTFTPLSNVIKEIIPKEKRSMLVSLLGPSFASEVIENKLTAISAVSSSIDDAKYIQQQFSTPYFRIYSNDDEIGSQVSAALKNVIAIASGIVYGLGEGENAKAALVTRGLQEIIRYGQFFNCKTSTFYGLTGIGDLLLTCSSTKSRNFYIGTLIGKNNSAKEVLTNNTLTVEGVSTCKYAKFLADKHDIYAPVINGLYSVLFLDEKPSVVIEKIMLNSLKSEN